MKTTQGGFFLTLIFLVGVFNLQAADSTNVPAAFQESWQTISNRWGSVALEKIKEAAETNEVTAQYYLGHIYDEGIGVAKNPVEAFNWMKPAAQQGMARAQNYLGWMYENGAGVAQDYSEAAKSYRLAAEQGYAMAQNNLGWLYKRGLGVPEDQVEAMKWFQKSADQGERLGAENLAWMYKDGDGTQSDFNLAEKWMLKAIDINSADGKFNLAKFLCGIADKEVQIYHQDTNRFPDGIPNSEWYGGTTNYAEAAGWFKKSAEQGYPQAAYELAEMYHIGKLGNDQRSNCISWYLKAAAQGNADAQTMVAQLQKYYPNNPLLASVDPIDALRKSAEQNDLNAQFDLAWRFHHGDGVPKDDVEAFKWMEKAAQHEISPVTRTIDAHYYLGVMYEKGEGVTNNLAKACELYQQAAVGGNKPEPFIRLGQMYEKGEGVPQDDSLAATNYFVATQFGFFPTSDDTARSTAIEGLLNLYIQGKGLPGDKTVIEQQLDEIKRTPITTGKGQMLFGEIYFQNKAVTQNLVEAAAWIRLAANQGFSDAQDKLKQVESVMSLVQKEAAASRFEELNQVVTQAQRSYKQLENLRRSKVW